MAHEQMFVTSGAQGRCVRESGQCHTRGCARAARRGGRAFPRTCYFNLDIDVEHDRKEGMVEGRTRVDLIDPRSV